MTDLKLVGCVIDNSLRILGFILKSEVVYDLSSRYAFWEKTTLINTIITI